MRPLCRWGAVTMVLLLAAPVDAAPGDIQTLAGSGEQGHSVDGGFAAQSALLFPDDVAVMLNGDVLIAESASGRVRKVDHQTGVITTVAGAGHGGNYDDHGDGVLAVDAFLHSPTGLVIESDGHLVIADAGLNRVFRVDAVTGRISTVAGTGEYGLGGDGGLAVEAMLAEPRQVALDFVGNILVVDRGNRRLRRISTTHGTIVSLFGSSGPFVDPVDVVVNTLGDIFVADRGAHRVWRSSGGGDFSAFAGNGQDTSSGDGGPPGDAGIGSPIGLGLDIADTLFIAGSSNRIRAVSTFFVLPVMNTVAGTGEPGFGGDHGPATLALFDSPGSMVVDVQGNLLVADTGNNRVRVVGGIGYARVGALFHTGLLLEDPEAGNQEGAPLILTRDYTFRPNQTWAILRSGADGYRLRGSEGSCVRPGEENDDGDVEMELGRCVGQETVWRLNGIFSFFNIRRPEPETCLSASAGPTHDLRSVVFKSCASTPARGWYMSPQARPQEMCLPSDTRMCLNQGRFAVEVDWVKPDGEIGTGTPVVHRTDDSGLFYFFKATNWEMLVKVLDNCDGPTNRFWVFAAASTTVEYTLTVTDTVSGEVREYFNPQGTRAAAIADTEAFATCP